jgi:hypothetical protein
LGFSKHKTADVDDLFPVVYSEIYTAFQPSYFLSSASVSPPVVIEVQRVILLEPSSPDALDCELMFAAAHPEKMTAIGNKTGIM